MKSSRKYTLLLAVIVLGVWALLGSYLLGWWPSDGLAGAAATGNGAVSAFTYNLECGQQPVGIFTYASGLGSQSEVTVHRTSGSTGEIVRLLPGELNWHKVTLRRGITNDMGLWAWRQLVEQGRMDEATRDCQLAMLDQRGNEVARWELWRAWPSAINGPNLETTAGIVPDTEEIVLAIDQIARLR